MRNICLTLAYDGTHYVGWQVQPNGRSVQAAVETALERLTDEPTKLIVAGRTDAGVHALGQVANFHTASTIPCDRFPLALRGLVPDDIVIRSAREVDPTFHATYSAKRKRYRYVIQTGGAVSPFLRNCVYRYEDDLDVPAMHAAAQVLLGTHDFRCFESHFPNKATSVRTVLEATAGRYAGWPIWFQPDLRTPSPDPVGAFLWFDIVADGFLYNMVRAIVGTLLKVGQSQWNADDVRRIIHSQDRSQAGETVPACGLYLVQVDYDEPSA